MAGDGGVDEGNGDVWRSPLLRVGGHGTTGQRTRSQNRLFEGGKNGLQYKRGRWDCRFSRFVGVSDGG